MENLSERQLIIIKYSLIQARQKYYDITTNLFISGNTKAFDAITQLEIKDIDNLIDMISKILKSKQQ